MATPTPLLQHSGSDAPDDHGWTVEGFCDGESETWNDKSHAFVVIELDEEEMSTVTRSLPDGAANLAGNWAVEASVRVHKHTGQCSDGDTAPGAIAFGVYDADQRFWGLSLSEAIVGFVNPVFGLARQVVSSTTEEYRLYSIRFDQASQSAKLYIDGELIKQGVKAGELYQDKTKPAHSLFFGTLGEVDEGGANFESISFFPSYDGDAPAPTPDVPTPAPAAAAVAVPVPADDPPAPPAAAAAAANNNTPVAIASHSGEADPSSEEWEASCSNMPSGLAGSENGVDFFRVPHNWEKAHGYSQQADPQLLAGDWQLDVRMRVLAGAGQLTEDKASAGALGFVMHGPQGQSWGLTLTDSAFGLFGTGALFGSKRRLDTTVYHKYSFRFERASQTASLYVDGRCQIKGIREQDLFRKSGAKAGVIFFGALAAHDVDDDAPSGAHFASVNFFAGQHLALLNADDVSHDVPPPASSSQSSSASNSDGEISDSDSDVIGKGNAALAKELAPQIVEYHGLVKGQLGALMQIVQDIMLVQDSDLADLTDDQQATALRTVCKRIFGIDAEEPTMSRDAVSLDAFQTAIASTVLQKADKAASIRPIFTMRINRRAPSPSAAATATATATAPRPVSPEAPNKYRDVSSEDDSSSAFEDEEQNPELAGRLQPDYERFHDESHGQLCHVMSLMLDISAQQNGDVADDYDDEELVEMAQQAFGIQDPQPMESTVTVSRDDFFAAMRNGLLPDDVFEDLQPLFRRHTRRCANINKQAAEEERRQKQQADDTVSAPPAAHVSSPAPSSKPMSEAETQAALKKILEKKKKTDLRGLLKAQREGRLNAYLMDDLRQNGLVPAGDPSPTQKQQQQQQPTAQKTTASSPPSPVATPTAPPSQPERRESRASNASSHHSSVPQQHIHQPVAAPQSPRVQQQQQPVQVAPMPSVQVAPQQPTYTAQPTYSSPSPYTPQQQPYVPSSHFQQSPHGAPSPAQTQQAQSAAMEAMRRSQALDHGMLEQIQMGYAGQNTEHQHLRRKIAKLEEEVDNLSARAESAEMHLSMAQGEIEEHKAQADDKERAILRWKGRAQEIDAASAADLEQIIRKADERAAELHAQVLKERANAKEWKKRADSARGDAGRLADKLQVQLRTAENNLDTASRSNEDLRAEVADLKDHTRLEGSRLTQQLESEIAQWRTKYEEAREQAQKASLFEAEVKDLREQRSELRERCRRLEDQLNNAATAGMSDSEREELLAKLSDLRAQNTQLVEQKAEIRDEMMKMTKTLTEGQGFSTEQAKEFGRMQAQIDHLERANAELGQHHAENDKLRKDNQKLQKVKDKLEFYKKQMNEILSEDDDVPKLHNRIAELEWDNKQLELDNDKYRALAMQLEAAGRDDGRTSDLLQQISEVRAGLASNTSAINGAAEQQQQVDSSKITALRAQAEALRNESEEARIKAATLEQELRIKTSLLDSANKNIEELLEAHAQGRRRPEIEFDVNEVNSLREMNAALLKELEEAARRNNTRALEAPTLEVIQDDSVQEQLSKLQKTNDNLQTTNAVISAELLHAQRALSNAQEKHRLAEQALARQLEHWKSLKIDEIHELENATNPDAQIDERNYTAALVNSFSSAAGLGGLAMPKTLPLAGNSGLEDPTGNQWQRIGEANVVKGGQDTCQNVTHKFSRIEHHESDAPNGFKRVLSGGGSDALSGDWRLEASVRVLHNSAQIVSGDSSSAGAIGFGVYDADLRMWGLTLTDQVVGIMGPQGQIGDSKQMDTTDVYHRFSLQFSQATQTADVYIDGSVALSQVKAADLFQSKPKRNEPNSLYWGTFGPNQDGGAKFEHIRFYRHETASFESGAGGSLTRIRSNSQKQQQMAGSSLRHEGNTDPKSTGWTAVHDPEAEPLETVANGSRVSVWSVALDEEKKHQGYEQSVAADELGDWRIEVSLRVQEDTPEQRDEDESIGSLGFVFYDAEGVHWGLTFCEDVVGVYGRGGCMPSALQSERDCSDSFHQYVIQYSRATRTADLLVDGKPLFGSAKAVQADDLERGKDGPPRFFWGAFGQSENLDGGAQFKDVIFTPHHGPEPLNNNATQSASSAATTTESVAEVRVQHSADKDPRAEGWAQLEDPYDERVSRDLVHGTEHKAWQVEVDSDPAGFTRKLATDEMPRADQDWQLETEFRLLDNTPQISASADNAAGAVGVVFFDAAGRSYGISAADGIIGLMGQDGNFSREHETDTTRYWHYSLRYHAAAGTADLLQAGVLVFTGIKADELRINKKLAGSVFFGTFGSSDNPEDGGIRVKSVKLSTFEDVVVVVQEVVPEAPRARHARAPSISLSVTSSVMSHKLTLDTKHLDALATDNSTVRRKFGRHVDTINDLQLEIARLKARMGTKDVMSRRDKAALKKAEAQHKNEQQLDNDQDDNNDSPSNQDKTRRRLEALTRERNKAENEVDTLRDKLNRLEREVARSPKKSQSSSSLPSDLEDKFDELRLENERLRVRTESLTKVKTDLEQEAERWRQKYHDEIDNSTSTTDGLAQKYKSTRIDLGSKATDLETALAQNDRLGDRIQALERELGTNRRAMEAVQGRGKTTVDLFEREREELNQEIQTWKKQYKDVCEKLREQGTDHRQHINSKEELLEEIKNANHRLNDEVQDLQHKLSTQNRQLRDRCVELEDQALVHEKLLQDKDARIEAQRQTINELRTTLDRQTALNANLEKENRKLLAEVLNLRANVSSLQNLTSDETVLRKHIDKQTKALNALNVELTQCKIQLKTLQLENMLLKENQFNLDKDALTEAGAAVPAQAPIIDELQAERTALIDDLNAANERVGELEDKIDWDVERKLNDQIDECQSLKHENQLLEKRVSELNQRIIAIKRESGLVAPSPRHQQQQQQAPPSPSAQSLSASLYTPRRSPPVAHAQRDLHLTSPKMRLNATAWRQHEAEVLDGAKPLTPKQETKQASDLVAEFVANGGLSDCHGVELKPTPRSGWHLFGTRKVFVAVQQGILTARVGAKFVPLRKFLTSVAPQEARKVRNRTPRKPEGGEPFK